MKRPRQTAAPSTQEVASSFADRVRDMREHFRIHGWYRAQDVRGVLGDPLERVQVEPKEAETTNDGKKAELFRPAAWRTLLSQ